MNIILLTITIESIENYLENGVVEMIVIRVKKIILLAQSSPTKFRQIYFNITNLMTVETSNMK